MRKQIYCRVYGGPWFPWGGPMLIENDYDEGHLEGYLWALRETLHASFEFKVETVKGSDDV